MEAMLITRESKKESYSKVQLPTLLGSSGNRMVILESCSATATTSAGIHSEGCLLSDSSSVGIQIFVP